MKKLLFVANVDWYVLSHRKKIIEKAVEAGWEVVVACEGTGREKEITQLGAEFIDLNLSRHGTNPFSELMTVLRFIRLYRSEKPDVVHHVSLKPVIYGSFVAKITGIQGVLNAISGLGYVFTGNDKGLINKIMLGLMKFSFNRKNLDFIFQNKDDYNQLKNLGTVNEKNNIHFIKGSGVDLEIYKSNGFPSNERIKILLPSKMLWDKGVDELRKASELLKKEYFGKIIFILAGMEDKDNRAGVSSSYLKDWDDGKYVKWIGHSKNMKTTYEDSHIVVLPSYREGMPKSLIEACSMARPIVTTTAIGCRECVDEGVNGFKVPVKSVTELAKAIEILVQNESLRISMGIASRKKAEKEFDLKNVISKHLDIYDSILNQNKQALTSWN